MALHYATAKSRQQALLKWIRQSPRIPQCKRFLKMFLPPSSGSVILSLACLRTLDRAFSSGGERFPDTEEVRSSNLLTPTKCSQLRGYVSGLFCFGRQMGRQIGHQISSFLIVWGYFQYSFGPLHKSYKCIKSALLRIYEIALYLCVNYSLRF